MDNATLFRWGVFVTLFLCIAAILTARQLFENYLEDKAERDRGSGS